MTIIKSLNAHATQILSMDTPVKVVINPAGREILVFDGNNISEFVLLKLPETTLPVPKVGTTEPEITTLDVGGISIPIQVSSGTQISNLPEPETDVIFMTSYPTAKAASEMGRKDFMNAGQTVYKGYNPETGYGTDILGCKGVNRFA